MVNDLEMDVKLKRIDVCDLLIACSALEDISNGANKWRDLHDLLESQLNKFDNEIKK